MLKIPLDSPQKELSELFPRMSAIVLRTRILITKRWLTSLLWEGLFVSVCVLFVWAHQNRQEAIGRPGY
jgi:hypothetical protein